MLPRMVPVVLILLLIAGCASPVPASIPVTTATAPALADSTTPTARPTAVDSPTSTVEPATYSTSLLVTLWDRKVRHHLLSPVDPASGEAIPGYAPIDLGVNYYHIFSPDRMTLAVISYIGDSPTHPVLHIIDLAAWREKTLSLDITGWISAGAFSPDGSTLAVASTYRDSSLVLIDLKQNEIMAQISVGFSPRYVKFTRDGIRLMAYGSTLVDRFTENERSEGDARVALFDARDLSRLWSSDATDVRDGIYPVDPDKTTEIHQPGNGIYFYPGVVFAPEADMLYAIHADEDKITQVDFARRSIKRLEIAPEISWFERFLMFGTGIAHAKVANGTSLAAVITPDGEAIYTTGTRYEVIQKSGNWEYQSTPLGLRGIRLADGRLLFEKDVYADQLSMAPDGSRLFLFRWGQGDSGSSASTEVFDVASSEFSLHYTGAQLTPARRMDGSLVLVSAMTSSNSSEATRMSLHDYSTGEQIAEWVSLTYAGWITTP